VLSSDFGGGPALPTIAEVLARAAAALADGDAAAALALARHVLTTYPRHVGAHAATAQALLAEGQLAAAEDLLARVLSAHPHHAASYLALARCLLAQGERGPALRAALIAREEAPDDPEVAALVERLAGAERAVLWPSRGWLARRYLQQGLYHRAAAEAGALLAVDEARLDLRVLELLALWRLGELTLVRAALTTLLEDAPDCLPALQLAAQLAADDTERAALWTRARQLDPEDALTTALFAEGELDLPPRPSAELPPLPGEVAQVVEERADAAAELRALKAQLERGEGGPAVRLALAALLVRRGDVAGALAHYRALLREPATDLVALAEALHGLAEANDTPAAWRLLGDIYVRLGDLGRAGAAYARGA
jgi:tetratricopeptide (TPR) repeat protein